MQYPLTLVSHALRMSRWHAHVGAALPRGLSRVGSEVEGLPQGRAGFDLPVALAAQAGLHSSRGGPAEPRSEGPAPSAHPCSPVCCMGSGVRWSSSALSMLAQRQPGGATAAAP